MCIEATRFWGARVAARPDPPPPDRPVYISTPDPTPITKFKRWSSTKQATLTPILFHESHHRKPNPNQM